MLAYAIAGGYDESGERFKGGRNDRAFRSAFT